MSSQTLFSNWRDFTDSVSSHEIATIHMEEGSNIWKQSGQKTPLQNSPTLQTRSKSSSNPSPPYFTTSSSNYSLPDLNLNINRCPLMNPDAVTPIHTTAPLAYDFSFQSISVGNSGSGIPQSDRLPRSCTMHGDAKEHHANEHPGSASSCKRQVGSLRKGKAKADGASTSEASSIMVGTEVRVEP